MKAFTFILLTTFSVIACKQNSSRTSQESYGSQFGYEDGVYCAEVGYYNPNTGTNSTYTLEVEIQDNELTIIHWPNGGWLDSSHFSPPIISSGEARFTSDSNAKFKVRIIGDTDKCL